MNDLNLFRENLYRVKRTPAHNFSTASLQGRLKVKEMDVISRGLAAVFDYGDCTLVIHSVELQHPIDFLVLARCFTILCKKVLEILLMLLTAPACQGDRRYDIWL